MYYKESKPMVFCNGIDIVPSQQPIENEYNLFGLGAFWRLKTRAIKRKIEFNLTPALLREWWLNTPDLCYYCGNSLADYLIIKDFLLSWRGKDFGMFKKIFRTEGMRKISCLTIDRKNNKEGYTIRNIVKSCWLCNGMKSSFFTEKETKEFMPQVIKDIKRRIYNPILYNRGPLKVLAQERASFSGFSGFS